MQISGPLVAGEPAWGAVCRALGAGCAGYSCEAADGVAGRLVAQWPPSAGLLDRCRKAGKFLMRS